MRSFAVFTVLALAALTILPEANALGKRPTSKRPHRPSNVGGPQYLKTVEDDGDKRWGGEKECEKDSDCGLDGKCVYDNYCGGDKCYKGVCTWIR
ncbi:hypothetical protein DdX_10770 [Ditylenchus destructor]|uniref:Uncharacterized protein n=1 Tax=Ditylenchus destructor TaxID=166010 RepID=A0AAD4MXH6_9BILA|nr:hypothetical protein DdX_10770 [Ditylenchus destructor]